jgi:diacylglycerol O-acyltransferase / wax synthase
VERLSGLDALFLYGDRTWPLHMGCLTVFDPSTSPDGLDLERVRDLFRQRLPQLGAFRHRAVRVPFGLERPVWVEEPDVDVARHIHAVRVPAPGDDRRMAELLSDLYAPHLDLSQPLWEKWVVEGIDGGLVGILDRLHHTVADGVRGVEIQGATYDLDPAAPFGRPGGTPGAGADTPAPARLLAGAVSRFAGAPARTARAAGHLLRGAGALGGVIRRGDHGGFSLPFTGPRTSLNGRTSARRTLAFGTVPLRGVTDTAKREHVKVNDVVLALAGGALRRYLDERGELPRRSLIAGVPVGLAGDGGSHAVGGNHLAVMCTSLATDVADPVERIRAVARSSQAGKAVLRAGGPDVMREILELAPPATVSVFARGYHRLHLSEVHPPIVNAIVSNIRGATAPLYLAGARLVGMFPFGPIADGLGVNITVLSYLDSLQIGITACPEQVDDPWRLIEAFQAEAGALAAADAPRPRTRTARKVA